MSSTMQLEFSQAMSDFKTMFPDMDREVIEAVLRANQGAVDATIDQLLAMSTDNQNEKLRNELDSPLTKDLITLTDEPATAATTTIDMPDKGSSSKRIISAATNATLLNLNSSNIGSGSASGSSTASPLHHQNTGASPKLRMSSSNSGRDKILQQQQPQQFPAIKHNALGRWNPPLLRPLPIDFLRLRTNATYDVAMIRLSGGGVCSEFDLPDEQFALMLQNAEFMNQLRWNEEFMKALEKEQNVKSKTEDDAAFKERLKNMGKMSRKKFLQIASVFTWQRNKKITTAKQIDSLPLKEEPSDDEEHPHHNRRQQQQIPTQFSQQPEQQATISQGTFNSSQQQQHTHQQHLRK